MRHCSRCKVDLPTVTTPNPVVYCKNCRLEVSRERNRRYREKKRQERLSLPKKPKKPKKIRPPTLPPLEKPFLTDEEWEKTENFRIIVRNSKKKPNA